jgi:hypothetical protein
MSQERAILAHLKSGKSITPIDALNLYGCFRLGARIKNLREEGHNIITDYEESNGKRYARYYIPIKQQMELAI